MDLTLETVKDCIGFAKNDPINLLFNKLLDSWYEIEISKGESIENAVLTCMEKMGATMIEMGALIK
jgi:hypothetical protein